MDPRFHSLGYATNLSSNAFENLGNPFKTGGTEAGVGSDYCADTTLRLDSVTSSTRSISTCKGLKRKSSMIDGSIDHQTGSFLCLRLGHSSSSSDSKGGSETACTSISSAKETDEESSMDQLLEFTPHLVNENSLSFKNSASPEIGSNALPKVDVELSLSSGHTASEITMVHPISSLEIARNVPPIIRETFQLDEGPVSSCGSAGIHDSLFNKAARQFKPTRLALNRSSSVITNSKRSVICSSSSSSTKQCQFRGCVKGARASSGFCIAHGGGRRCQKHGCHKGAEGRTAFCKAHGGGRRCEFLGCTKSAEGRSDFCIAHGGGQHCSASHGALVQDKRVHGGATLGVVVQEITPTENIQDIVADEDTDIMNVEESVVTSTNGSDRKCFGFKQATRPVIGIPSPITATLPDGRVHGGSFMSILAIISDRTLSCCSSRDMESPTESRKSYITHQSWM